MDQSIQEITPTNWEFRRLLSSRTYRLAIDREVTTRWEYYSVKKNTEYLPVGLGSIVLDGKDPIRVLSFIAHYVTQADELNMTEREAYISLPHFLADPSGQQYQTARSGSSQCVGVCSWSSAVNLLLRAYTTGENIRDAVNNLLAKWLVKQRPRATRRNGQREMQKLYSVF